MWQVVGSWAVRFGSWCFAHKAEAVALLQAYQAVQAAKAAKK